MNCKEFQREILEALAAGEGGQPSIVEHLRVCADCQAFHQVQSRVFGSMDQALGMIANSPVPPSLLPTVRSRVQVARRRRSGFYGWLSAGVVGAAVCAVLVAQLRHVQHPGKMEPSATATAAAVTPNSSVASPTTAARLAPPTAHFHPAQKGRNAGITSPPHLEVIVDRKERDDLTRLANSVRRQPAWGQGFLREVPVPAEEMKPLPDIEIAQLRVTPLVDEKW